MIGIDNRVTISRVDRDRGPRLWLVRHRRARPAKAYGRITFLTQRTPGQHPHNASQCPTLHCEFEGSRIRDMLNALEAFSFGGSWCKKNWFFRALCVVLQTIFAPLALAAVAIAWAAATDGSDSDALVGGGHVASKDWVVVRGRWAYDGGHEGWSEVHATRIVQKIDRGDVPTDPTRISCLPNALV